MTTDTVSQTPARPKPPVKRQKQFRLSTWLSPADGDALDRICIRDGITRTQFIERAIRQAQKDGNR